MNINIKAILDFFDDSESGKNSKYSNTIVLLLGEEFCSFCFKQYMNSLGYSTMVYNIPCKKKGKTGKWLDRWITCEKNGKKKLYQVEIKTWNSNGFGGKPIKVYENIEKINNYAGKEWAKQWIETEGHFKDEKINKCLLQMDPPKEKFEKLIPNSLLIYWLPIANKKITSLEQGILFTQKTKAREQTKVEVFSVSLFLRHLLIDNKKKQIRLPEDDFKIMFNTINAIKTILKQNR